MHVLYYNIIDHFPFFIQSVAHPQCMQFPFFWWSYPKEFGHERSVNGKICNELEAKMAASYCYWLYSEGFTPKHVAILSPYRAQVSSTYQHSKYNIVIHTMALQYILYSIIYMHLTASAYKIHMHICTKVPLYE